MPPGGQAEYSWDGDTASLTINFATVGIKKKSRFTVRVQLTDCYEDFMNHLKASKGVTGRLVMEREPSKKMTLAEVGIPPGAVLKVESFKAARRFDHKVPVKLPNGTVINVPVHSSSTISDLKHMIQDEIGMPVEQQSLEHNDKHVNQDKKIVVEIVGHKTTPLILKWVPSEFKLNYVYKNNTEWIIPAGLCRPTRTCTGKVMCYMASSRTTYVLAGRVHCNVAFQTRKFMQYGLITLGALLAVLQRFRKPHHYIASLVFPFQSFKI